MKKILIVLVLLLCASTVSAEWGILNSLYELQWICYSNLSIDTAGTAGMPAWQMHDRINLAYQRVWNDFPAIPKYTTVVTDGSSRFFDLPIDFVRRFSCVKLSGAYRNVPLEYMSPDSMFQKFGGWQNSLQENLADSSLPRYYSVHGDSLMFYPMPRSTDTYVIGYYGAGTQLSAGADTVYVESDFIEPIINYATYLAAKSLGREAEAQSYLGAYMQAAQAALITEVTEQ